MATFANYLPCGLGHGVVQDKPHPIARSRVNLVSEYVVFQSFTLIPTLYGSAGSSVTRNDE